MTPLNVVSSQDSSPRVIQNWFTTPSKKISSDADLADREKNKKMTYAYFVLTGVMLIVYGVFFFYPNLNRFLGIEAEIGAVQKQVDAYEKEKIPSLEEERIEAKIKYESTLQDSEKAIDKIFPATLDKIGLTERLETFASLINSKTPPFELNQISFDTPLKERNYMVLPFSTTITTSRANLDRLFKLIDLSGRFDNAYNVRLMEIEQMDIRLLGQDSKGVDRGLVASIKFRAYSR